MPGASVVLAAAHAPTDAGQVGEHAPPVAHDADGAGGLRPHGDGHLFHLQPPTHGKGKHFLVECESIQALGAKQLPPDVAFEDLHPALEVRERQTEHGARGP